MCVCTSVIVHDGSKLSAGDHLAIEQGFCSFYECALLFCQEPSHAIVLLVDDPAHFAVDLAGGFFRVVAFLLRRLNLTS